MSSIPHTGIIGICPLKLPLACFFSLVAMPLICTFRSLMCNCSDSCTGFATTILDHNTHINPPLMGALTSVCPPCASHSSPFFLPSVLWWLPLLLVVEAMESTRNVRLSPLLGPSRVDWRPTRSSRSESASPSKTCTSSRTFSCPFHIQTRLPLASTGPRSASSNTSPPARTPFPKSKIG